MKILPLTPAQSSFVEVEFIGRYAAGDRDADDEGDPSEVQAMMPMVVEHFERSAGHALAVPDPEVMRTLILDVINDLDTAIDAKRSEQEFALSTREARALHRAGSALLSKVYRLMKR
jgi:hypothetical protein